MKVDFSYIVARNKLGKVVFCEQIQDCYSEVCMTLYKEDGLTFDDIVKYGKSIYGDSVYTSYGKKLDKFSKDGVFTEQQEAKDLTGIYGDIVVVMEIFELDIF